MMPRSPSKKPSERRIAAERAGHRGEMLAALFLQLKFYRLRQRRFKTPMGEIDLVVERAGTIVFVEVKYRRRLTEGANALGAVNTARIGRAAEWLVMRRPRWRGMDMRFDVIFLAPWRLPRHLVSAFILS